MTPAEYVAAARAWADWLDSLSEKPDSDDMPDVLRALADLVEGQQWKPIATAPKIGPLVDLWQDRRMVQGGAADVMPDQDRAARMAEDAIRKAILATFKKLGPNGTTEDTLMVLVGAIKETGSISRSIAGALGGSHYVLSSMEQMLIAHLRGALRGADGPLKEDGGPYPT